MRKLLRLAALNSLLLASPSLYATSYQIFANINFSNPAALNSVKQGELILGGTSLFSRFHFTGRAAGINTGVTSNTDDFLPYGRWAVRLGPKVVVGIDVTQPYFTDFRYPRNAPTNVFATETFIRDTNFSPKLSIQATERLALGVGLDFNNFYNGQLNFSVPPFGLMTNKADSWATGFDAGLFYVVQPGTFLNLIYYSKIVQHAKGTSTWGPFLNSSLSADVKFPTTYIANVIQLLSPFWVLNATLRYAQWNTVRFTVLQNTAAGIPITVPDNFYNNISAQLATRYQINEKWGALAGIDYEPNVQPTYTRNIGLPTYTRVIPGIGAEYEIKKGLKAKLIYAHAFSKPPFDLTIATGQRLKGHGYLNADAIDLSFTLDT